MRRALFCLLLAIGCGRGKTPAGTNDPTPQPPSAEVLTDLSVLARGHAPTADELADWRRRLAAGEALLGDYVDTLLASPAFSRKIAPEVILGHALVGPANQVARWTFFLKITPPADGPPIYYLNQPCARRQAVRVSPWWNLKEQVLVCPDSYRPDVWKAKVSGGDSSCDATDRSPSVTDSGCGCGPNLLRCLRDWDDFNARVNSAHAELRDTVAYVIEHGLPYADIFSGRASFHDRNVERIYRFWRIEAEQRTDGTLLADLDEWPDEGKWADRFESRAGQHAGILTAPGIVHFWSDRRQRQWLLFERMWCKTSSSVGALPEDLLALGSGNFQADRNEGWKELAEKAICTDCHARTDYGFQFFWAFPDPKLSAGHFVPSLARNGQKGTLYGRDIRDPRGEAELTPAGFAQLAIRQPEFGSCMAQTIAEHVLGTEVSPDDVRALADGFDAARVTVKQMAKAALLRWAARAEPRERPATPHDVPTSKTATAIALSGPLREAIDINCGRCHYDGAGRLTSFDDSTLSREVLVKMLSMVAAERMPRDRTLRAGQRLALVDLLAEHVWHTPVDRVAVHRNLSGTAGRPAVWRWSVAQRMIRRAAGAPESSDQAWNALEAAIPADRATYTPGFAAMATIEAVEACTAAGKKEGAALERCVSDATRPERFLRR